MLEEIKEGMEYTLTRIVGEKDTALNYGSGGLEVFATPGMIALMENAAYSLLHAAPVSLESVGTEICVQHTRACKPGTQVTVRATVSDMEGKKIKFLLSACDGQGEIGKGTHTRYIIDPERFMSKLG